MLSFRLEMPAGVPTGVVVAVHGLMESAACLRTMFPAWASQGLAVLAVDLRGHGGSPRWTLEQLTKHPGDVMVTDLVAVLNLAEVRRQIRHLPVLLYGHSAGGGIAAAAAAALVTHGEATPPANGRAWQVAGVLLEDPFWRLPVTRLQARSVAEAAYTTLVAAKALVHAKRIDRKKAQWPDWDDAEIQDCCQAQTEADEQLVRNGNVIPSVPWPAVLDGLKCSGIPVLIVTGTNRVGFTPVHQHLALGHGATVEVIRGASHFVRRDAPDAFRKTASKFFADCIKAVVVNIN
ncbi:alpha/beta hydrolase [Pseudarthrobacter sp. DSP2-3-2b1]|uniref:alpha/beta hydrolase n=1 Tax=Pseudarthrobacter sp. DSP2-3-2b1 TaxID=2804661 RepID=UPI003CF1E63E